LIGGTDENLASYFSCFIPSSHWERGWVGPRASLAKATKIEKFIYLLGIETWSSALYQHCVVEQLQHYFN